ncbi:MAG: LTA synthase family protein [Clostridia bacterium]|nr:LTA synthase family protein [Clostridia bacterium]
MRKIISRLADIAVSRVGALIACNGALLLSMLALLYRNMISVPTAVILFFGMGLLTFAGIKEKPVKIPGWVCHIVSILFTAFVADVSMQLMTEAHFYFRPMTTAVINYLLYCIIIGVIGLFFRSRLWGLIAPNALLLVWTVANYFLMRFRSRPLYVPDFWSLKTAMAVAGNYTFEVNLRFISVVVFFIAAIALAVIPYFRTDISEVRTKALIRCGVSVGTIILCATVLLSGITVRMGFASNALSYSSTYLYTFMAGVSSLHTAAPEGYSPERVAEISESYESDSADAFDMQTAPNVIVVMNESFSDFDVIKELETNIDVMPFIDSLSENTVKGYTYSSVFGGNTANAEYEFLTGDTMAYVTSGFMPYTTYIKTSFPSLVSSFDKLGYTSTAMHPAAGGNWNRLTIYDFFGFDNMVFKDDYSAGKLMRSYISDSSNYQNLIAQYEAKDENERLFIFNITMQNHGGYTKTSDNFTQEVYLTDCPGQYPEAEQYLSLIHESDKAVQELVGYFAEQEEPTVILFFGDHQPGVGESFYDMLFGKPSSELTQEEIQRKYMSPFFIWANFDIEEKDNIHLSLNYLSSLLLDTAGLPMTGYQRFLWELHEQYPIISSIGAVDKEGKHYADAESIQDEMLAEYHAMVHNHLFDVKNREDSLFELSDSVG